MGERKDCQDAEKGRHVILQQHNWRVRILQDHLQAHADSCLYSACADCPNGKFILVLATAVDASHVISEWPRIFCNTWRVAVSMHRNRCSVSLPLAAVGEAV